MNGQLSPATCSLWEQQAQASTEVADIWCDYAMMMAIFQSALERAPRTAEECHKVDIEHLFVSEIEHLADLVNTLFPAGGMMEFADYVTGKPPERPIGERTKSIVEAKPAQT